MTLRASTVLSFPAAGLAAIALSACGGSSSAPTTSTATPPATTTHTVTHTVSPPPTTTLSGAAPSTTSATGGASPSAPSAAAPGCTPKDLGIHLGSSSGAAGTIYVQFDFVNVTSKNCTLQGYPGVSLVLTSGRVDDITNNRNPADKPHLVTVKPRGRAPFVVGFVGSAAHPCVEAGHLRFIPPNDYAYEQIRYRTQVCGSFVDVAPVGYGNG